jgi:hypothetical protein
MLASSRLSVRPFVPVEQLGSPCMDFHEISYLNTLWKSVEEIHVSLKSDKNNEYFTWRPIYMFGRISFSSSQNEKCHRQKLQRKLYPTVYVPKLPPSPRKSCSLWDNVDKYCRAGQTTYGSGSCPLHAGYIRLQTHLEYVTLIVFPLQQLLHKHASVLLHVHCLSCFCLL